MRPSQAAADAEAGEERRHRGGGDLVRPIAEERGESDPEHRAVEPARLRFPRAHARKRGPDRSRSSAITITSRCTSPALLELQAASSLETERFDRVETGSPARGIESEENADRRTEEECHHDGGDRNQSRPIGERGEDLRSREPKQDADDAAQGAERDGFDEELGENITCRARRPPAARRFPASAPSRSRA